MKLKTYSQQPIGIALAKQQFTNNVERELFYLVINQLKTGFNISYDLYENLEFLIPLHWVKETNFKRIKEGVIGITDKKIIFVDENLKSIKSIVPFPEASYNKNGVKIILWNKCVKDFIELSNGYTRYQLEIMQSLRSDYSQRLYEILSGKKNMNKGLWEGVSIEYLKFILNAENYEKVGNFMQKVIVKAQYELKEKADIGFNIEKINTGRKLTHLTFNTFDISSKERIENEVYSDYEQINKLDNVQRASLYNKIINQYSFSPKQMKVLLNDMSLFDKLYKLNKGIESGEFGEIRNPTAYIAKSLGWSNN